MADPKIKFDIEAQAVGGSDVEVLAKSLESLGETLEGEVRTGAEAAAAALRELASRNQAAQTFAALKREVADLGAALDRSAQSVESIAGEMPAAAAATRDFAASEARARTAVDETQQGLAAMRQALVDLRAGNESAARGTDEYRSSVNQARGTIADLRATLKQQKVELKEAEAGTRSAAVAEKELGDQYKLAVNATGSLSKAYGDRSRALDEARSSAQGLGVDTAKLRQEEQALTQGMEAARLKIEQLSQQQADAARSTRERADEERRLEEAQRNSAAAAQEAMAAAKAAADAAATAAVAAGQRMQNAFSTLGVRSAAELRAEIAQVKAAMQTVEVESGLTGNALRQALSAGNDRLRELQRELRGAQGELTLVDRAAGVLRTGLAQITGGNLIANAISNVASKASDMGRAFLDANLQMEGMRRALTAVYKDANVAASQIDFLRKTATDAGVSAGGLTDSFKSFAASTQAANIPLETTNALFASVTQAGATLGLSGERVSLVLQALGQMAAKGTVSMEELRQQLGESLPGALSLAAQGLGLTEAQLIKLVESGGLAARDLFPALAKSLKQLQGEAEGTTTVWERFKNALTLASQNAGDAGGMQLLTAAVKALGAVVGIVVIPLAAFAEVIFGVAKAVGVLVGSISTLSNPLDALGKIVDDAAARQRNLTDTFGALVFGADAAAQSQAKAGVAIAQAGRDASAGAAGVAQNTAAHTASSTAAQSNAASQSATAIAARVAGDASMDAGAKWVQLGVKLREVAAAQDQQVKNSEKLAAAAKIEGEGLQALAELRGNDLEVLQVASDAAEANASALEKVAAAREAHLATLRAELQAKQQLIAGNAEEQKARAVELQEIQKKIDALDAETASSRASAEAAKNDASMRRASVGAYQDNAQAVGALRVALEQARTIQEAFQSDERRGLATKQEVADAIRRTAEAQRLYNDALNDAVLAEQRKGAAAQSLLQLEKAGLDVEMAKARAAEQKAVRDGNEFSATQARIKQKEIEVAALKLTVQALNAEADAMDAATNKKIEALVAQGKWTEAQAAEMQALRQSAELKRLQASATREGIAELERQIKALKNAEDATRSVGNAARSAAGDFQYMAAQVQFASKEAQQLAAQGQILAAAAAQRSADVSASSTMNKPASAAQFAWTRTSIIDYLKQAGLDDLLAERLSKQFVQPDGSVPYEASGAQIQWGGKYSTLAEALGKMAEYYRYGDGKAEAANMLEYERNKDKKPDATSPAPAPSPAPETGGSGGQRVDRIVNVYITPSNRPYVVPTNMTGQQSIEEIARAVITYLEQQRSALGI
ncbi:tape measure protein [Acidovorax sp. SUPP2825]|uniref:tape measure protein n=1 Tax=Acidovorax sp. SUPP2825 TaxID=2920879 RepID=UPI0023DE6582|nr:tape measure protein [Acidovorax sp. SUPP2825]GKS96950.1 tape measure protein [Acidovorax sp. SUPP2825]